MAQHYQATPNAETAFAAGQFVSGVKNNSIKYESRREDMEKDKLPKKSPLLDLYIQKQNQQTKFDEMDEEELAKAIRSLMTKDETSSQDLN